jgi:hypothetical protein
MFPKAKYIPWKRFHVTRKGLSGPELQQKWCKVRGGGRRRIAHQASGLVSTATAFPVAFPAWGNVFPEPPDI